MVHFGLRLRENAYAQWKHEYIKYKKLKRALRKLQHAGQDVGVVPCSELRDAVETDEVVPVSECLQSSKDSLPVQPSEFEGLLEQEYQRVERAYLSHTDEIADQLHLLQHQFRVDASGVTQFSLKNALTDLHRLSNHLLNFALMNYTACVKILKKHDKRLAQLRPPLRALHIQRLQSEYQFAAATKGRELVREIEETYANAFCDGNLGVASALLTAKREDFTDWSQIYIGCKLGACFVLLITVVWDSLIVPFLNTEKDKNPIDLSLTRAYPVYRGLGGVLLLQWMLGLSLYVWRSARINYNYIFELHPGRSVNYAQVFNDATNMTIAYLINVLMYYKVVNGHFPEELLPRGYYPLILYIYAIYFYLFRRLRQQVGFYKTILQVVCSPFVMVTFLHTFVGDYLTSTVKLTQDLSWSICFFASSEFLEKDKSDSYFDEEGNSTNSSIIPASNCNSNKYYINVVLPLISALPLWWRFLQNIRRVYDTGRWWPHLANAIKYALTQVVALFGLFHPFYHLSSDDKLGLNAFQITWLALFSLSSLYSWVWDVTMDWGLGRPRFRFLNERQMFSRSEYYYTAIVVDLFLRFAWTLSLIPPQSLSFMPYRYLQPFTMAAELFRRTFWSFFRLENEHLRNTQGFRRIDFIPLHYDHGTGAEEGGKGDSDMEPMGGKMFMIKIGLVLCTVIALSALSIQVAKDQAK